MNTAAEHEQQTFTIVRGGRLDGPPLLMNLLRDTSAPVLVYLAEKYGLPRVPGLSRGELVQRILRHLTPAELTDLQGDLIAARYGARPVEDLLAAVLRHDEGKLEHGRPRLDDMPSEEATLIQGGTRRWLYTMHGHDVVIDMNHRYLACSCPFFRFASHRRALCKHLARALTLVPEAYAREVLIDLLIAQEYGGPDAPAWQFTSLRAA